MDEWTSPRSTHKGRSVPSTRELYHPAVQDLSEQAARHGQNYEETILQIVSPVNGRQSVTETFVSPSTTPSTGGKKLESADSTIPAQSPTHSLSSKTLDYIEEMHRQRVLVSAYNRNKLNSRIRRSKTTVDTLTSSNINNTSSTPGTYNNCAHYIQPDNHSKKFDIVITNSMKLCDEEQRNSRKGSFPSWNRYGIPSSHGNLVSPGTPLPYLNGYHQQLTSKTQNYNQSYLHWLTSGFKVQSFRVRTNSKYNPASRSTSHCKQRPRNIGSLKLRSPNQPSSTVDINVVGVHKDVHENGLQETLTLM
ncbi:hypothetical protein CHS0354_011995 [Potamilus streckersoni]|uniref:Uncharacterized protein n=1 Tax=Potamilus streckersoni TaxID=2493646 RepID=A0AAE0SC44_9BIVA|nr:hypothetical protein CHS0354_011995 [Potamilus streckersoni]